MYVYTCISYSNNNNTNNNTSNNNMNVIKLSNPAE